MIDHGTVIMSLKLRKQLKALERKEKHIQFGQMLDEVGARINEPKRKRNRRLDICLK